MKLFLKILFFIFTMIIITVGEIESSTVTTILQEETLYSFIQKSQHGNILFENYNTNSCLKEEKVLAYCERVKVTEGSVAKGGSLLDDILDAAKSLDDNAFDIADAGLANWKNFQNRVATQLQTMYPNSKIGNQIYLDVTYIDNTGKTVTKTIIPDDLVQIEANGITKYKVIDAKTSIKNDLVNMNDLTGTCTANQKEIYPLIDDLSSGRILKVEMKGAQATTSFPNADFDKVTNKASIQLDNGVEFWVNADKIDFTKYVIRNRTK